MSGNRENQRQDATPIVPTTYGSYYATNVPYPSYSQNTPYIQPSMGLIDGSGASLQSGSYPTPIANTYGTAPAWANQQGRVVQNDNQQPGLGYPLYPANTTGFADESHSSMSTQEVVQAQPDLGMSSGHSRNSSALPLPTLGCDRCGKVLTGTHAQSNLTRHQKSQKCSGQRNPRICQVCGKDYSRTDGLGLHMKNKHPGYQYQ